MPDFGVRDFGKIVPADEVSASGTAPRPAEASTPVEPPMRTAPILAVDRIAETDHIGVGAALAVLAALVIHRRAETPFAIGLLGGPGSGKSTAAHLLLREVAARAAAGRIAIVPIDAARLDGPAVVALADQLHTSLAGAYPGLVGEALHASRDPHLAAREAFEALDVARRKLSGQRLALENEEARRAGLVDSVLFETAGTQIDAYVRANRSRIRHRLAGLGIEGEPTRAFKQLVQPVADGGLAEIGFVLRAFWAFKGQATLVVIAALSIVAALAIGYVESDHTAWLARLREIESTRAAADWLEANMGLLATVRHVLFAVAGLAVAINFLRALRLVLPVFRAGAYLREDLAQRRRQADVEFGHEVRRVESLAAEVDTLAQRAAEAERRATDEAESSRAQAEPSPFQDDPRRRRAERFIAAVGRLVARVAPLRSETKARGIEAPDRIVVALDGLDSVDPARARDLLATADSAFGAGFVTLVAADPARLKAATGEHGLDAWIQVPFQVGGWIARGDPAALARAVLGDETAKPAAEPAGAASSIDFDRALSEAEVELLAALAPLAGRSPRAVKRFVNLYRVARFLCPDHEGMLALFLALEAGGTEAEKEAVAEALGLREGRLDLDHLGAGPRLGGALASVRALMGDESLDGARRAAETAQLFSFRPWR